MFLAPAAAWINSSWVGEQQQQQQQQQQQTEEVACFQTSSQQVSAAKSAFSDPRKELGSRGFIFDSDSICRLLHNLHVVVIGDSIQRGVYKDLVLALQEDRLLSADELKKKVYTGSFLGDRVMSIPELLSNNLEYYESREFVSENDSHLIQFHFVTRVFYDRIEGILQNFEKEPPDVVIMNSCLWDITRFGATGEAEDEYLQNLATFLNKLKDALPPTSVFIWLTTPPIASHVTKNQFLRDEVQFLSQSLRKCILDMNCAAAQIVGQSGFDVLDTHFYLRPFVSQHRSADGVHWDPVVHRHVTELILLFLLDSTGERLPPRSIEILKRYGGGEHFDREPHLKDMKMPSFLSAQLKFLRENAENQNAKKTSKAGEQTETADKTAIGTTEKTQFGEVEGTADTPMEGTSSCPSRRTVTVVKQNNSADTDSELDVQSQEWSEVDSVIDTSLVE